MPLSQRVQESHKSEYERLFEQLLSEWRSPDTGHDEPVIIEESPGNDERANHLYVVWSAWETLTPIERSRLILQAYERYRGHDMANSVTLAMGLTPREAELMSLNSGA
jgi:hypothetical protein